MKQRILNVKTKKIGFDQIKWLLCLFVFISTNFVFAQTTPSNYTLTWNINVGCQLFEPPKPRDGEEGLFIDDIETTQCIRVCEGSKVTYTLTGDLSNNPNVQWTVVGGTTSATTTTTTPTYSSTQVTWGNYGLASISFSMNSPSGGIITKTLCIEIVKKPQANFTAFPIVDDGITKPTIYACVGQPIVFTDLSVDNGGSAIDSHYWDFGNGDFSADENPTYIYYNQFSGMVALTVTNSCGCTSTIKRQVVVKAAGGFQLECASTVCEGQTSTYSLPFGGEQVCEEYNFTVNGGHFENHQDGSLTVTWDQVDATGFGLVTFTPGDSCHLECLIPTTIRIPVIQTVGTIDGNSTICLGKQERYKLPQWPTTDFHWYIEGATALNPLATIIQTDQRNEIIVHPTQAGTIKLICTYQNTFLHCGGSAEYTIQVSLPEAITGPTSLCINSPGNYTTTSGHLVNWTLKRVNTVVATTSNTNSFNYNFTTAGNYSLTVTGPNVCDNQTISITVNPIPPAILISNVIIPVGITSTIPPLNSYCPGAPYTFSVSPANPNMDYIWTINGGTFIGASTESEVTVSFNASGPYSLQVVQKIKGQPTCVSPSLSIPINVFDIYATITDSPTYVLNTNPITQCANNEKTYYAINSVGGSLYSLGETYTWTITPSYLGSVVLGQGSNTAKVQWNNITTASETATLTVQITKCTRDTQTTISRPITIVPQRNLTLAATNICSGNQTTITLSSNITLPVGTTINWNYGNGSTSTQTITTASTVITNYYTYNTNPSGPGSFLITATIANPSATNCSGMTSQTTTINVAPGPPADISILSGGNVFCIGDPITTILSVANAGNGSVKWWRLPSTLVQNGGGTYHPTAAGGYYFTSSYNGCTSFSPVIVVSVNDCTPPDPCILNPYPQITLTSTGSCNTLGIHASTTITPPPGYASLWTVIGPDTTSPNINQPDIAGTGTTNPINFYNFSTPITAAGVYHVIYKLKYICNGVPANVTPIDALGNVLPLDITVPYLADFTTQVNCATPPATGYSVNLTSNSSFMFNIAPANRRFYYYWSHSNAGPWTLISSPVTSPTATFTQPTDTNPNYYFKLVIGQANGSTPTCQKISGVYNLAPNPVQTIGFSPNPVNCYNTPVIFSLSQTFLNETYLWTFDTGSTISPLATSTLASPTRVFDELPSGAAHNVRVTVEITNRFGCKRTLTTQTYLPIPDVPIPARCYYGNVSSPSTSVCKGGTMALAYTPNPSHADNCAVASYQWMNGNTQIGTSTTPTYTVNNVTGTPFYWVRLVNASGCVYNCAGRISPNYKPQPTLQLAAPSIICNGGGTVNATATVGSGTTIAWTVDGNLQSSTGTSLALNTFGVGTHTLSVTATLTSSGCTKTISQAFTVKVVPPAPTVSYSINCSNYMVTLTATPPPGGTGTLTWSTGTPGNPTQINHGGPYMVTYNDGSGCTSSAQLDVPNSLDKYLWIFPKGCYNECDNNLGTIIGPTITVPQWWWEYDNNPDLVGGGLVDPYTPTHSGVYNLALNNGACPQTSEPMNLTIDRCEECEIKDVRPKNIECKHGSLYAYTAILEITNTGSSVINATITAPNNEVIVVPSSFNINPSTDLYTFDFILINGFTEGIVHFLITGTNGDGKPCTYEFALELKDCEASTVTAKKITQAVNSTTSLLIYPNPTHGGDTKAQFECTSETALIAIYDLTGKQLASYNAPNKKGTVTLNTSQLAAGVYVVVLKEEGKTTLQKKLVVE